jgi:hypothetical protein
MSELADRFDYGWLAAGARIQLGTLAVAEGRLDEARDLLDEALDLSLAIRIMRNVTLCLASFAQLAFAEGDPERAALLAGAAEACVAGPGSPPGPRCGGAKPSWQPRSARRWEMTGSVRRSRPGPDSASRRRWPPSGTGAHERTLRRMQAAEIEPSASVDVSLPSA